MIKPIITPSGITKEYAVGDIIKSIAELSLSHKLSAESKKNVSVLMNPAVTEEQIFAFKRSLTSVIYKIFG